MRTPRPVRAAFRRLSPRSRRALLQRRGIFAPWEEGYDYSPPPVAPGETTGPPDFVGIGVQKGGTSWWYELVVDHPDVWARPDLHKERHYFSHLGDRPFGAHEVSTYASWFPRAPGTITGEWTPDYLAFPWVPPLLAAAAPRAKLLVLLRDPVERFRSGLSFRLAMGAEPAASTVEDAVRQGFYARWLRGYLDYFARDQVLVLQYEACAADPATHLAATYRFLGLDPHTPADLLRPVNPSGQKVALDDAARRRLVDLYEPDVGQLAAIAPDLDRSRWPNFAPGRG
ncbi:MAG: sulfotransferase domain-containing protein [Acidimicrobiales bacterium]|nr:sulfotransferase domain-containing protein [Acidimicrobiales bacterium]